METKKLLYNAIKIVLPLVLGGGILYWMYRDFDFAQMRQVVLNEMNWTWMLLSMPFGILAQTFRGWRWKQVLEPLGEQTRNSVCVNSIFLSYAVSLVIPRVGEFARCGVLSRYDNVAFPKALGTVVTERAVDIVIVILMAVFAILTQIKVFTNFFFKTGTNIDNIVHKFSMTGWFVTGTCAIAVIILLYIIRRHLPLYKKVKGALTGIWQGITSVRNVKNMPLFVFYSLAIWGCYFLHFYLTFFCFRQTALLGATCALVCFVVGSIAVIVPTPNGAGPWHFAVKTMLIIYGVADVSALYFVLIVHTLQTLLVILLGVYAWIALAFTHKKNIKIDIIRK